MKPAKSRRWTIPLLVGMLLLVVGMAVIRVPRPVQAAPNAPADTLNFYLPVVVRGYPLRYTGVFVPLLNSKTWNSDIDSFVTLTGKAQAVYLVTSGFACDAVDQVIQIRPFLDHIHAVGAMPLITWVPMDCSNGGYGNVNTISLQDIINGTWDAYIEQWASDIGALGYPVFVRWGHEMNIPSYSWAGQTAFGRDGKTSYQVASQSDCGLNKCFGDPNLPDGPERYIAAYRHVHDLAAPRATNIVWVWNPCSRDWPLAQDASWNQYNNYYPGDAYVDWIGLDEYNWGDQSGNGFGYWIDFAGLFDAPLIDLARLHPTKPQMIAEFGSVEDPNYPDRKPAFIRDAYRSALNYPNLQLLIWVQDNHYTDPYHYGGPTVVDMRVNSSAASLQAYEQAVSLWASSAPLP